MLKFSYLHTITLILSLFGYALVPLLLPGSSIVYRALVVVLSVFVISFRLFGNRIRGKTTKLSSKYKSEILSPINLNEFFLWLFIFIYSIRLIHDTTVIPNELFQDRSDYFLLWFGTILIPGICFIFENRSKHQIINYIFLILFLICLLSIRNYGNIVSISKFGGRLSLEGLNPISLGSYSGSLIITSVTLILSKKHFPLSNRLGKFLFWIGLVVGILGLFLSASRGPLISTFLVLGIVFFIFISRRGLSLNNKNFNLIITFVLLIFLILFILNRSIIQNSPFLERFGKLFETIVGGQDIESLSDGRAFRIADSIDIIFNNIVFGYGLELPNFEGYPHNLVVESFLSTGFIGGIIFVSLFSYGIIKSIKLAKDPNQCDEIFYFLYIQYALNTFFSGALYSSNIFWYLLIYIIHKKKFIKRTIKS